VAKILARAANCEYPADGEPCGQCVSCRDILQGGFMDVIEIDAASNRGIDEIRELREQVNILPAQGKRKVYIIDEAHMLTAEAFNALLKTLEEPPATALFVLATTELHKIPATIVSRCQKYGFYRLTPEQIETRLRQVAEAESVAIEDSALGLIARRAGGGMRDALGMLDQALAYAQESVTHEQVREILGLVDEVFIADLVGKAIAADDGGLIRLIAEGFRAGMDARQAVREVCFYLRELLGVALKLADFTTNFTADGMRRRLEAEAQNVQPDAVRAALTMMMGVGERLRYADEQQFTLEMAFLELSRLFSVSALPQAAAPEKRTPARKPAARAGAPPEGGQAAFWQTMLAKVREIKIPAHAMLSQGHFIGVAEDVVYIGYKKGYKFHKEKMEEKDNQTILRQALKELTQRDMRVEFMFTDDPRYNDLMIRIATELFGPDKVRVLDEER
jgi:DNA polymerase-3 subunit gamma/tau